MMSDCGTATRGEVRRHRAFLRALCERLGDGPARRAVSRFLDGTSIEDALADWPTERDFSRLLKNPHFVSLIDHISDNPKIIEALALLVDPKKEDKRKIKIFSKFMINKTNKSLIASLNRFYSNNDNHRYLSLLMRDANYMEDLLATRADADWLESARFEDAYAAGAGVSAWGIAIRWRVYTLICCAQQGARLDGDFVECGVDRGGTAMCVLHYLGTEAFRERTFHLFDTYEGLVRSQMTMAEQAASRLPEGRYPSVLETVRETFAPFDFVRIVPGAVPETLTPFPNRPVAYLHIDMNVAYPECAALRFFWPRLAPGAPVVFDDYGFPFHREQRKALDATAAELGVQIMMLPTGQGLLWK